MVGSRRTQPLRRTGRARQLGLSAADTALLVKVEPVCAGYRPGVLAEANRSCVWRVIALMPGELAGDGPRAATITA
jgi:hypothetical protein